MWFRQITDIKKNGISKDEFITILDKVKAGKSLTIRQEYIYDSIVKQAQKINATEQDAFAGNDLKALEKEGWEIVGGRQIPIGDFKKGDKVVVELSGGRWDEFEVKDEANANGEVLLEDGVPITKDPWETEKIIAIKRAGVVKEKEKLQLTREVVVGDSVKRLKSKKKDKPQQETLTTAFETAKDKKEGFFRPESVTAKEREAINKKKDEDKPKKKVSGYILFCQNKRGEIKAENQQMNPKEITTELGRLWKEMNDEERAAWTNKN
jgi:hypothetical protein